METKTIKINKKAKKIKKIKKMIFQEDLVISRILEISRTLVGFKTLGSIMILDQEDFITNLQALILVQMELEEVYQQKLQL